MKFLDCFVDDPLPSPEVLCVYDCEGPAVWLGPDGKPVRGYYKREALPLVSISEAELEEQAATIIQTWGDPGKDREYHTRHPHIGGKHNLLLYGLDRGVLKQNRGQG